MYKNLLNISCILLSLSIFTKALGGQLSYETFPLPTSLHGKTETFKAWKERLPVQYTLSGTSCSSIPFTVEINGHRADNINWSKLHKGPISSEIKSSWQNLGTNVINAERTHDTEDCLLTVNINYPVIDFNQVDPPTAHGFKNNFVKLDAAINKDIKNGFPGATLLIIKDGHVVKYSSYGYLSLLDANGNPENNPIKTNKNTIYDLASLTKIFSTTFIMMHQAYLNEEDKNAGIDINQPLDKYDPGYHPAFPSTTVEQLLNHSAGNPPDINLYDPGYLGWSPACDTGYYSLQRTRSKGIEYLFPSINSKTRGENVYSDVDYIILGFALEHHLGEGLAQYLSQLYAPLFIHNKNAFISYQPLTAPNINKHNIASTTYRDTYVCGKVVPAHSYPTRRQGLMTGKVNDPTAYHSLGEISGHAGLFANIQALAILSQLVLNGGGYGATTLFDEKIIQEFITSTSPDPSYAQGWRVSSSNKGDTYLFGDVSSPDVFGHDGWTGTFVVVDKKHNMIIIGLTNKRNTRWGDINKYNDITPEGKRINKYSLPIYGNIVNLVYGNLKGGFPGHFYPGKLAKYLKSHTFNQTNEQGWFLKAYQSSF